MLDQDPKLKFFEDTIKDVVTELGYTDVSVHFKNISEFGVNYMADIIKANVVGTKNGTPETLFFVVKAVSNNPEMRLKFRTVQKFTSEVVVYDKILKAFDELQEKHNIKEPFKNCGVLITVSEEFKEMLLMNDITRPGLDFEQSRLGRVLDLVHARSVVKNIGKVHALSFATKKYSPGFLEKNLTPGIDKFGDEMINIFVEYGIKMAISIVEDPIAKEKILDILPSVDEYIAEILDHKLVEPYAVLVHGDVWTNNIMFKYEGDTLVESFMLDWQMLRYHSPIHDLLFFMCISIEDDVREANFQSLLDLYHSSLSAFLVDLNCDPEELFPRKAFDEQLKKFTKFALIDILLMLPFFAGLPVDLMTVDTSEDKSVGGMPELTDLYKKRVNATLRDLINNGLF